MNKPRITEAEWPIMTVLWDRGSATAAQIVGQVAGSRNVSARTIKTLLRRLVLKNMVGFSVDPADSRIYHYRPLISREQGMEDKNRSILNLVYQGDASALLASFVASSELSDAEIDRLQAMLEQKKVKASKDGTE